MFTFLGVYSAALKKMELVYTVTKSHRYKRRDFVFRDERPLISLSARNSLALCTTTALTEDKAEQYVVFFFWGGGGDYKKYGGDLAPGLALSASFH